MAVTTEEKTFIQEAFARRIPQIIGMYVATVWLAVEIGDWVTERFSAPDNLSSFIFVGLLTLLPTVIIVAWGHGKPGRDRWTKTQVVLIPLNIAAALFAMSYLIKPVTAANKVTTLMSVVDEAGLPATYEVAKEGFHQPVMASFWSNTTTDKSSEWLGYASAWLVAEDLRRSPIISVQTPYDSSSLLNQFRSKGFDRAMGSPLSLDLQIAANRSAKWLVRGEISKLADLIQFTAYLYDVSTGEEVKTISASGTDWLNSLDQIAEDIEAVMTADLDNDATLIPDLSIAEHTSQSEKAIKHLINSRNAVRFENDYETGVAELEKALQEDQGFANAHFLLMLSQRAMGDFEAAIHHARSALMLDYKLYQETAFLVKAVLYSLEADTDKTLKVLENWVKVYPESIQALETLAGTYINIGQHLQEAKAVYEKLYALEPDRDQTLIDLSNIYRLEGDSEKAIKLLQEYVSLNTGKADAHLHLAEAYFQFGQFNNAKRYYEEAVIYDSNNMKAEIGLVKVQAAQGDYAGALQNLEALRDRAVTDSDHYQILDFRESLLYATGQIKASMENLDEWEGYADKILPPISLLFDFSAKRVAYLAINNQVDEALELTDKVRDENKGPVAGLVDIFYINIYQELGDLENYLESAGRLEKFLQEYPIPNVGQYQLAGRAKVAFWQKQYEESLQYYDQAIEESRQSVTTLMEPKVLNDLLYDRAKVLHAAGRYQEAIEELNALVARDPFNGMALLLLANNYNDTNDLEQRDNTLARLDKLWANADPDYKEFQKLQDFKQQIAR